MTEASVLGRPQSEAAAGGHAVWVIARRELADQLMSLRFLVIALLVVGLAPLAVYVGARDYANRLAEYNRLLAEQQELVAGEAGEAVRGFDSPWTPHNELIVLRALRPPEPLSVLVRGLDGALPAYWDFSSYGIVTGPPPFSPQQLGDLLGQLDLEFLIRVVLGLLAILLAFDAVAGEKESGTLRLALSQPISRPAFLMGKLIGGAITLLVPLLAAFLVAALSAQLLRIDLLGAERLARVALLAAASGAYLLCLYAIGLMVSSLTHSQKTSLVVLLVTWVVMVLAVAPLATLFARAIVPVPLHQALEAQKQALEHDIRREAEAAMGAVYREITGLPEGWADTRKYRENKAAIDERIAPIEVAYLNKRRRLVGELERDAERRARAQHRVMRIVMAFSPGASFATAAADLAGTGDAHRLAWLEAVARHQSSLNAALFDNPPTVTIRNAGASFTADIRTPPTVANLPSFVGPRRDVRATIARASRSGAVASLHRPVDRRRIYCLCPLRCEVRSRSEPEEFTRCGLAVR
jgi:ABC-2 type transport system permease protein